MSNYTSDADEQMARDMQLAMDLQKKEEKKARKRSQRREHGLDGFANGNIAPDNMLFVSVELDGRLAEMLVDSGASYSTMTVTIMCELGLQNKLSTDISGEAGGVGHAKIIGVIRICPVDS